VIELRTCSSGIILWTSTAMASDPLPLTLKRRRGHGWRGGCPAADMPAEAVDRC